ncbi:SufE family protein [Sphingomonas sp.]|uniref:SufE family protein n=1 Tax=Sphingomonas sp. TaxID=28214 RepID=UPI002DD61FEF|nr:SufE family protein [Sphingomonas sp.]
MARIDDLRDEYAFLDFDDRIRFLIELGEALPEMAPALKTEATQVKGCSSQVWLYPEVQGGRLHFQADGTSAITKGVVALVLEMVQDRTPADILASDIPAMLAGFELSKHLTSNRTQGIPNMIALIRDTAARYA